MSEPLSEPLRFERHFVEKVWGGRSLESRPGIALPAGMRVGETWEIVDRRQENSVVAVGTHRGRTLAELMVEHGAELLGTARPGTAGRFPLLVKYLDASSELSVQVHPDEEAAAALGGEVEAKTEAWYVVDADAGGCLYAGLREEVERERFARLADGPEVVGLLRRFEVRAGDTMLVPGGTVHAIGAGVRILEVQQNSDTTYRLYDWGRLGLDGKPRETHVDGALACVRFGAPEVALQRPAWSEVAPGVERAILAGSHVFGMEGLRLTRHLDADTRGAFRIYAVIEGVGRLATAGGRSVELATGDVWLLPAVLGAHRIEPAAGALRLVDAFPRG